MRYAFHLTIRHGMEDEYDRRHAGVWDDMKKMLKDGINLRHVVFQGTFNCNAPVAHSITSARSFMPLTYGLRFW